MYFYGFYVYLLYNKSGGVFMIYLVTFAEGMITFISPCLLPMLPIYFTYLGGGSKDKKALLKNALGFTLGFSITFMMMGALSGQIGKWLLTYQKPLNIIFGLIVILCGLSYMGLFQLPQLKRFQHSLNMNYFNFLKSMLFGLIFSISWTPCVGTFLASALLLAASQSSLWEGIALLGTYSLGLAVPMLLSSLLLEQLQETFTWIKKHYDMINKICGAFLVVMGILMACGILTQWLYK